MHDSTHALYRFWGADDQLLYVGISYRIESRLSQHRRLKPWDEIARVTIEQHPNRDAALKAEKDAIQAEKPKWNVMHNDGGASAETLTTNDDTEPIGSLVGHFFHTTEIEDDGCELVNKQGHVVLQLTTDVYLVEWFSWIMGEPTNRTLVPLSDMVGWRFYDDMEWFHFEYEHRWSHRSTAHQHHLEEVE